VSYKAEVIVDKSGKWCDNAIRFATASEVHEYTDLEFRWAAIRETRVVGSDDPVNYVWADGRLMPRVERAMNIKHLEATSAIASARASRKVGALVNRGSSLSYQGPLATRTRVRAARQTYVEARSWLRVRGPPQPRARLKEHRHKSMQAAVRSWLRCSP